MYAIRSYYDEARRFGEEMLYQDLRDQNTDAILNAGVQVITSYSIHYTKLYDGPRKVVREDVQQ